MLENGLYNIIGAVIRLAIGILTIPLLIRFLGVEMYGLWTLMSTVIALISLAEGGLSVSATVFLSRDLAIGDCKSLSETLTTITGFVFILATIASLLVYTCAEHAIDLFGVISAERRIIAITGLQVASLAVWAKLFQQVMMGVEQACQRYRDMNILNILQSTSTNIGLLLIAFYGGNLIQLMEWTVVVSVLSLIGHIFICYKSLKNIKPNISWNFKRSTEILNYSMLTWTSTLGTVLFSQFDRVIVSNLLGLTALGTYAAITTITVQINALSALPIQPLIPFISSNWNNKDSDLSILTKEIKLAVQTNSVFSLGLGLIFFTLAPLMMQYLLKKIPSQQEILEFRAATVIYSVYSLNAVGYYILLATNGAKSCTMIVMASGAISLLLIFFGANSGGILGAIVGNSGYILTLALVARGMKQLGIKSAVWIEWFWIPILWFLLSILFSLTASNNPMIQALLLITELVMIMTWFGISYRKNMVELV